MGGVVNVPSALAISEGASDSIVILVLGLEPDIEVSCEIQGFRLRDLVYLGFKVVPEGSPYSFIVKT